MTEEQKYIVSLSKAAIFDETPSLPPENLDWQYIWDKALEQNISGLLASAILKLPKDKQPENSMQWRNIMMQTMLIMSRKNAEFERMMEVLKEHGIEPICLKGCVIKDLYPEPTLRSMGDFDIWIERRQRIAAESTFEKEDYRVDRNTLFSAIDKNGIHGELFISLEDDFRSEPAHWDDELKKNVYVNTEGKRVLTPTYELAYSIIHAAKHLTREGCGLRNMLDAALILKYEIDNIDLDKVYEICGSQGYERVLIYLLSVAVQWYGLSITYDKEYLDADRFLEYLLCHGIFGKDISGNILAKQVMRREGDNVSEFRRIFFPPKEMIWHKYQYVKKSPLLLPIAWVHRFITAVFINKYSVRDMVKSVGNSIGFGKDREKWLNELGIH